MCAVYGRSPWAQGGALQVTGKAVWIDCDCTVGGRSARGRVHGVGCFIGVQVGLGRLSGGAVLTETSAELVVQGCSGHGRR